MDPVRLPGGKIRSHGYITGQLDGGDYTGEGVLDLAPGDPGYADADAWLTRREQASTDDNDDEGGTSS